MIAAAIAARTSRIRIGTAVTVLSTDDPVRVFQRFSTINAISNGRAEVIVGRGSFTESFPLFGYDLSLYEQLFEEKLNLWVELLKGEPVSWNGRLRSGLHEQKIYPPSESGTLTTGGGWGKSGIGGPGRVLRTAVDARHHRRESGAVQAVGGPTTSDCSGSTSRRVRLCTPGSHCRNGRTGQRGTVSAPRGDDEPHWRRTGWPPSGRREFEHAAGPDGALYVGSPETVAAKIAATVRTLGLTRFDLKYSNGTLPHELQMKSIERDEGGAEGERDTG